MEQNFREKFEELNRVHLTDGEFQRLLDAIITGDVFAAARVLRERNSFTLDDLIAVQGRRLDALKPHKKGLMQQLFPSPAAVEA